MTLDLRFTNHGNVWGITPETNEGDQWLTTMVSADPWQWMGPTLYVDQHAVELLQWAAAEDGLRTN